VLGYLVGKYRERRQLRGRDLTEYDFYPYQTTADNFAEFSLRDFRLGMHYLLRNRDSRAARQLIFIGEQNNVRDLLDSKDKQSYEKLYSKYRGAEITSDANEYMENYRNIVRLLGRTFPQMGIEILLHDLANPSRSVVWIEGAEVTGRSLHMGTTTLLVDLKKRRALNEDKLNYELNLGARRFKCTTIPIIRKEYGVVGAICMNIDINYIRDEVLKNPERTAEFLDTTVIQICNLTRTSCQRASISEPCKASGTFATPAPSIRPPLNCRSQDSGRRRSAPHQIVRPERAYL
jgi:hypothetical protein